MKPLRRTPTAVQVAATVKTAAAVTLLAALILSASSAPNVRAQTSRGATGAVRAAEGFYRHHFSRDGRSRSFLPENIRQLRRWLSPELYRLMMYEFRREAEFRKTHPDDVPFMTGDPFTNSQESPDTFRVGRAVVRGRRASVPVTFGWRDMADYPKYTLRVELLKLEGRWLIHNVKPNEGSDLLKLLRRPVYDSDVR